VSQDLLLSLGPTEAPDPVRIAELEARLRVRIRHGVERATFDDLGARRLPESRFAPDVPAGPVRAAGAPARARAERHHPRDARVGRARPDRPSTTVYEVTVALGRGSPPTA